MPHDLVVVTSQAPARLVSSESNLVDSVIAGLMEMEISISPETLKYWVGVQRGQSYLMGRRYLFSLGWPPF